MDFNGDPLVECCDNNYVDLTYFAIKTETSARVAKLLMF